MSTMLERIAAAIVVSDAPMGSHEQAREVLAAMREPTEAMIAAANRNNHPRDIETWRTMIDEAVK